MSHQQVPSFSILNSSAFSAISAVHILMPARKKNPDPRGLSLIGVGLFL
ncbi:MAG: hypothetical protein IIA33_07215 [Planctomycetes bacterium]|nr:hypothetical protein [Planctomycetota bacterium]